MRRLLKATIAVLAVGAALVGPSQPASAGPIDLPPDGEARLTISVVGDADLDGRLELFLTAAGMNMFDTACAVTDTAAGAVVTYECTGLMQRAHFLEANGALGDEEIAIACGLPGGFASSGGLADLQPYPYVLDCTVTVAVPGIRIFSIAADGTVTAPPASVQLFDFIEGVDTIDLDCVPEDVDGDPAVFCESPASGEYEVLSPDNTNTRVSCIQGSVPPSDIPANGDSLVVFGEFAEQFGVSSISFSCAIREFDDTAVTVNDLFIDIQSSDPGPDLAVELTGNGADRSADCARDFEQQWICTNLPPGTYTVSATGLLPGQFAVTTCFDPNGGFGSTADVEAFPFGIFCSIEVDVPQVVLQGIEPTAESTYVVLDSDGNDVGDACGPAVSFGEIVVSCQLPLGSYTIPEQAVESLGVTGFICDQDNPWFFENTATLTNSPQPFATLVVRCFPGVPDRLTFLNIEVRDRPIGTELLVNGTPAFEVPGCFQDGGDSASDFFYFCEFQGEQTVALSIANTGPVLEPRIECRSFLNSLESPPSLVAELTEEDPDWECRVSFFAELPATGPSIETPYIAALGAAFLAAGLALTAGSRRSRLF